MPIMKRSTLIALTLIIPLLTGCGEEHPPAWNAERERLKYELLGRQFVMGGRQFTTISVYGDDFKCYSPAGPFMKEADVYLHLSAVAHLCPLPSKPIETERWHDRPTSYQDRRHHQRRAHRPLLELEHY
jgi:hypothetical protein